MHLPITLFRALYLTIFNCHNQQSDTHAILTVNFLYTTVKCAHFHSHSQCYTSIFHLNLKQHAIQKQKHTQILLEIHIYTFVALVNINPLQSPHIAIHTQTVRGLIDWKFFTRVYHLCCVYISLIVYVY